MTSSVPAPVAVAAERARVVYTRVAALGLVFIAAIPLLFIAAGLVAGQDLGDDLVFFLGVAAVALAGAALVRKLGLAGRVAGLVASILAGGSIFWAFSGIFTPSATVDFVAAVLWPLGVLMGMGGAIAALVAGRRGHATSEATRGERRIMRTAVGLVALALVVSVVTSFTTQTTIGAAAAQGATAVEYASFEFGQSTYTVAAGEVKMLVHNGDAFIHDFAVPALGVEPTLVNPGSDALVEFTAAPGTYLMFCTLHSDTSDTEIGRNMAATLVVE